MPARAWFVLDLALVAGFAVIGRLSHDGSLSLAGWWTTAWPFLAGAVVAWGGLALARRTGGSVGDGVAVWLVTLAGGMALRQASGQGTAAPFVVVATLVLGALLVLPRVVARVDARRRG